MGTGSLWWNLFNSGEHGNTTGFEQLTLKGIPIFLTMETEKINGIAATIGAKQMIGIGLEPYIHIYSPDDVVLLCWILSNWNLIKKPTTIINI